jgi:cell division protein FtsL
MLPVSDFRYKIENIEKTDFFGKVKLKILIVFAIILSSLFAAQIVIAGGLTADGKKLHQINEEALKLQSENLYLKSQIAQISSLTNLSQKAQTLGFNKPLKVLDP